MERATNLNDVTAELGRRLRQRRKELKLTITELGERAGLSVGFISQVERDITIPSLSSLASLCTALDADIGMYLQQPRSIGEYSRYSERETYAINTKHSPIQYERVSADFEGRNMRSVLMHIPAGYTSETVAHDGEELIFVLEGEINVILDGKQVVLQAGDSVHHTSKRPHAVSNHTTKNALALWVGTQDLFGDGKSKPGFQMPDLPVSNLAN